MKTNIIKFRNRKNNYHGKNTCNNPTDTNRNRKERASASGKKKGKVLYNIIITTITVINL